MAFRSAFVGAVSASLLTASFAAVPVLTAAPAQADVNYQVSWAPDGQVRAIATDNSGTQFLGGDFTAMDLKAQGLAVVDPASASDWHAINRTFPSTDGSINAVVSDGSGGWFVGGDFHSLGSPAVTQPFLAHINADGSVSPDTEWFTGLDGPVYALSLVDGVLYAGGSFTVPGAAVVALDPSTGGMIGSFGQSSGTVRALAVQSSGSGLEGAVVYAGGAFNDGVDHHLAAFVCSANNAQCALDQSWAEPQLDDEVRALALEGFNNLLYFGGSFTTVDADANLGYLARVDALTGTVDTTWTPSPDSGVLALDLENAALYAGGSFTSVGVATNGQVSVALRNRLAALDLSDPYGAPTPWNPNADGTVTSLDAAGLSVFVGGQFTYIGGANRAHLVEIDITSGSATNLFLTPDNDVSAVAIDINGQVAVGGLFTTMATVGRSRAAALDSTGGLTSWDPIAFGSVNAIAVVGSNVLLGGAFTSVGSPFDTNPYLALVDGTNGYTVQFPVTVNGVVRALSVRSTNVFVGGDFTSATDGGGTVQRHRLARLSYSPTWAVDNWQADFSNGQVRALAWVSTTLYVGGSFTGFEGPSPAPQAQLFAAAVDVNTGELSTAWDPAPNGPVNAITYTSWSRTVFLGGEFTALAGSVSRPYAGAVADVTSWTGTAAANVRAWNPRPDGIVRALLLTGFGGGANVALGGDFDNIATYARAGLAQVTAEGSGDARSWKPLVAQQSTVVRALALANGIAVGGIFSVAAQVGASNFAVLPFPPGEPGPMEYSPTTFGVVPVGSPTSLTVLAINRSGFVVFPRDVTVTGSGVSLLGSCSQGNPIPANAACVITLSWTPGSLGSLNGATLSMTFNASPPDSSPSTTVLTGLAADTASAPTSLTATPQDGSAEISFTPGADGGDAITNYEYSPDGSNWTALSPADTTSPVTIPNLTNGTNYSIQLRAVTGAGPGAASSAVSVTPVGPTPPAPLITSIDPSTGSTVGGTRITISGSDFAAGAIVSLDGLLATSVTVVNSSTITASTPAHSAGTVDVIVANPDAQSATLTGGFTYTATPGPTPNPKQRIVLTKGPRVHLSQGLDRVTATGSVRNIPVGAPLTMLFKRGNDSSWRSADSDVVVKADGTFTLGRKLRATQTITIKVRWHGTKSDQITWRPLT